MDKEITGLWVTDAVQLSKEMNGDFAMVIENGLASDPIQCRHLCATSGQYSGI